MGKMCHKIIWSLPYSFRKWFILVMFFFLIILCRRYKGNLSVFKPTESIIVLKYFKASRRQYELQVFILIYNVLTFLLPFFFSSKDWNTNLWTNIWIMNKIRLYDWIINHSNVIYEDDSTRCVNCRKLKLPSFIVVNYSQSLCWNMTWSYWHKSIAYSHIQRWETCDHNK